MTSYVLFALAALAALCALSAMFAFARRGAVRAPAPELDARPLADARETHPETPAAPTGVAVGPTQSAEPTRPTEPVDPVQAAARDMARGAYEVAQHLGFDAMPDRARPSLRKLRIPLDGELSRRAAALLADGAHGCVQRLTVTRDQRAAITIVDLSADPPA